MRLKLSLLWPFALTLVIPLAVAYFVYPSHLPPQFGVFPPVKIDGIPGFNVWYFAVLAIGALMITAALFFPRWFCFKPPSDTDKPASSGKFPWWFYLGALFMLSFWWLMWSRSFVFGDLVYYAFSPMWWGFIIMLDGIVYKRNDGKSLIVKRPKLFLISAVFSIVGWYYFEYFDYFVWSNWYYPNGHISELPHSVIVAIFLVAYSTVWPAIFEWYTLLQSYPKLAKRWSNGPKIKLNGTFLLVLGLLITAGMTVFPHLMFWGVWVGPMAMLTGQLIRKGVWTPYSNIANGDWSSAILIALASLFNGFLWEFWNHGSEAINPFNSGATIAATNPNYWIYDVPYVNVIHLYSEMPLLGYFGYLPFGLFVWIMYIWAGKIFGWRTDLNL